MEEGGETNGPEHICTPCSHVIAGQAPNRLSGPHLPPTHYCVQ
jgi:hypothetical protein